MSIEQSVIENLRELPIDKQIEVLDFVEFLSAKSKERTTLNNYQARRLVGRYAHLGIHISKEEIAQARKEMWGNFPRDIEP